MGAQFGRVNFDGQAIPGEYIEKVTSGLAPYGPDSIGKYTNRGLAILYGAFCTTREASDEKQPHVFSSGEVMTWDGRLDNRRELVSELKAPVTGESNDLEVVAAAFEKWNTQCFARLIGDWALAIIKPKEQSVLLAKDAMGTKPLYYEVGEKYVAWSTILVLYADRALRISEEFIAGWFSHTPAENLTPYSGIQSVPASCYVLLKLGRHGLNQSVRKYWDFDPAKTIHYRTDEEYEEHFRVVFAQAVQRRLRSDRPVLIPLSGGMDSSSIVCMADLLMSRGQAECPGIETISWFDSSNPNWDDPVYIDIVEKHRGHVGLHIDLATDTKGEELSTASPGRPFVSDFEGGRLSVIPAPSRSHLDSGFFKQALAYSKSIGNRVSLSGVGGEQPTGGGIPSPNLELQDLLTRGRLLTLVRQLTAWAAKMRRRRLSVLWEALREFLPFWLVGLPDYVRSAPPWFQRAFVRRNRRAFRGYASRIKFFGPRPSFQEHLIVTAAERRLRAWMLPCPELLEENRYPFFDRDLREFAYAVPREQVVGVGKRRFLLKRAMTGIVPDEVLNRKPRSFAATETPGTETKKEDPSARWPRLDEIGLHMVSGSFGIIEADRFMQALQNAQSKDPDARIEWDLRRTLMLEFWLRHLANWGVLLMPASSISPGSEVLHRDGQKSFSALPKRRHGFDGRQTGLVKPGAQSPTD